jgi:hypothetical protein
MYYKKHARLFTTRLSEHRRVGFIRYRKRASAFGRVRLTNLKNLNKLRGRAAKYHSNISTRPERKPEVRFCNPDHTIRSTVLYPAYDESSQHTIFGINFYYSLPT